MIWSPFSLELTIGILACFLLLYFLLIILLIYIIINKEIHYSAYFSIRAFRFLAKMNAATMIARDVEIT